MCCNNCSENKCCDTCYKNKFCTGSGWFCKVCNERQNECSNYGVIKTSKRSELSSRKER